MHGLNSGSAWAPVPAASPSGGPSSAQPTWRHCAIFWKARGGGYGSFTYNEPTDDGLETTPRTVRFENAPLTREMVTDSVASLAVTLIELP